MHPAEALAVHHPEGGHAPLTPYGTQLPVSPGEYLDECWNICHYWVTWLQSPQGLPRTGFWLFL